MNRDYRWEMDTEGIAWLSIDQSGSGTNVLSESMLSGLEEIVIEIAQNHPRGMVICSAKQAGFIAGADVKSFVHISDRAQAEDYIKRVHEIFQRIEALAFPTVAILHGYCLGGGLELALACDYRVARDDVDTRLGFPEVRLGIFPGFGGTVRSLRTIGALKALPLMLSARTLDGRQAKRLGLIDLVVPGRQLRNAARQLLREHPKLRCASFRERLPAVGPLRLLTAFLMQRKLRQTVNPAHYPAPYALLRHWAKHGGDTRALYASEAREVARLLTSDNAQQLIRVFLLQDRLKQLGDREYFSPRHVHVVGGGCMGGDIAAWCALKGMRVTLQDRKPELLGHAMSRAHELFSRRLKDPYRIQAATDRLIPDCHGDGIARADVVIEAIYEDLDAKHALFAEIEPHLGKDTLLASNTSAIPLAELARDLDRPGRLVGLHFFNPVAKMPLLEVVTDKNAEGGMVQRALAFARHIDKLPLPVKSSPGFLINRVLMPYLLEAVNLLEEGHPAEAIDAAAVDFGMPMGPIELADTVGLDICLAVATELTPLIGGSIPERLQVLVDAGQLGKKSGQGFYAWIKGRPQHRKLATGKAYLDTLATRMIGRLVEESLACLQEGLVDDADLLDAGVIFGTGFPPFRGGPIHYHQHGESHTGEVTPNDRPAPA